MNTRKWYSKNKKTVNICLRLLALSLIICILAAAVPFGAASDSGSDAVDDGADALSPARSDELLNAVYAFSGYSVKLENAKYLENGKDDGVMLTDRKYTLAKPLHTHDVTEGWVMISAIDPGKAFSATVDMDFGFTAVDVCRFYLRAYKGDELLAVMPDRISFYVSENGTDYSFLGVGTTLTDTSVKTCAAIYGITLKEAVKARYLRVVIESDGSDRALWINEIGAAATGSLANLSSNGNGYYYDNSGVLYRIGENGATVVGLTDEHNGGGALAPSSASFNKDAYIYTLGKGSDNEVKVISHFIGEKRLNYSGVPNDIRYIIIHNTGTPESETDAQRYDRIMHTTIEEKSWHYSVDENVIYHSLADSVAGWHAGTGLNYESIGVEMCVNGAPVKSDGSFVFKGSKYDEWVDKHFRKTMKNTAVLVAELLVRYDLTTDAIIQHYDTTEKNCPQWLRNNNGKFVYEGVLWLEFLSYVDEYYKLLKGSSEGMQTYAEVDIVIPDYVTLKDGEIIPVTSVSADAFTACERSIRSVTIGKSVLRIEDGCFDGNEMLEYVNVVKGNLCFYVDDELILRDTDGRAVFDPNVYTDVSPAPKEECSLDIREVNKRHYLFLKPDGKTLSELAELYGADEFRASALNGDALRGDSVVGTGTLINFDGARIYAAVLGDINGDAIVDAYDYIMVKRCYMRTYSPLRTQLLSVAFANGEQVTVYDYVLVKRYVMGTYNFE